MRASCLVRRTAVLLSSLSLLAAGTPGLADTVTWNGSTSSDWSNPANWDVGPPTSGDDVVLTSAGSAPANQDIAGLDLNAITFATDALSLTISGQDFTVGRINAERSSGDPETYTFQQNVAIKQGGWTVRRPSVLRFEGTVSESGGSVGFSANNNGQIQFVGPVTITGGFRNNQTTVQFFGLETTGAKPGALDDDYFRSGYGAWRFRSPDGSFYNDYVFDANVGVTTTNTARFIVDDDVQVTLAGPVAENDAGKSLLVGDVHVSEGSGVLVLAGNNTFTGGINVARGLLVLDGAVAPGTGGARLTLGAPAAIDLAGHDLLGRDLQYNNGFGFLGSGNVRNSDTTATATVNGDMTQVGTGSGSANFGGPGDILYSGDVTDTSDSQAFVKIGPGTLTMTGTFSYPGATHVRGGTLVYDYTTENTNKAADAASLELNGKLRIVGSAVGATSETIGDLKIGRLNNTEGDAAKVIVQAGPGQTAELKFDGLEVDRDATLDFAPDASSTITTGAATNRANSGVLGGNVTFAGSSFARVASSANPDGTLNIEPLPDAAYATNDFGDYGSGDTALYNHVDVSGAQTLSVTRQVASLRFNDGNGPTTLSLNSALRLYGDDADGNHHDGAILVTPAVGGNQVTIDGSGMLFADAVNGTGSVHQYNTAAPLRIDARLFRFSAGTSLTKVGPGELILTDPNNSFTNLYLFEGALTFVDGAGSNRTVLGMDSGNVFMSDASLRFAGTDHTMGKTLGLRGPATIEVAGTQLDGSTPTGVLTVTSDVSSAGNLGSDHWLTLAGAGDGVMAGDLALGLGGLRKTGAGTWTVSGANTYRGATQVLEGTLLMDGSTSPWSGVSVASGATLGGGGTLGGPVVVQAGGMLSPGTSPGILAFGEGLALADTAGLLIELGGTTPGTGDAYHDQLVVEGGVRLGTGAGTELIVDVLDGFTPQPGDRFLILDNLGDAAVEGLFAAGGTLLSEGATFQADGFGFQISYLGSDGQGNDVVLSLAEGGGPVIPEPSTWILMALGALLLGLARRRRP